MRQEDQASANQQHKLPQVLHMIHILFTIYIALYILSSSTSGTPKDLTESQLLLSSARRHWDVASQLDGSSL